MAKKLTRVVTIPPKPIREMEIKQWVAPAGTTRVLNPRNAFAETLSKLLNAMR